MYCLSRDIKPEMFPEGSVHWAVLKRLPYQTSENQTIILLLLFNLPSKHIKFSPTAQRYLHAATCIRQHWFMKVLLRNIASTLRVAFPLILLLSCLNLTEAGRVPRSGPRMNDSTLHPVLVQLYLSSAWWTNVKQSIVACCCFLFCHCRNMYYIRFWTCNVNAKVIQQECNIEQWKVIASSSVFQKWRPYVWIHMLLFSLSFLLVSHLNCPIEPVSHHVPVAVGFFHDRSWL